MFGGAGNDAYFVDNAGDLVIENANEGTDTVYSTAHLRLGANVENLVLQGSADLQGYGNSLTQRDLRQHRQQHPGRRRGRRRDVRRRRQRRLLRRQPRRHVIENVNEGIDTVYSTAHLPADGERGKPGAARQRRPAGLRQRPDATRSTATPATTCWTAARAPTRCIGGAGNDTYYVDNAGDVVVENANEGNDTVFSTANLVLAANVETLVLQGSADLQGYGNSLSQRDLRQQRQQHARRRRRRRHHVRRRRQRHLLRRQCRRCDRRERQPRAPTRCFRRPIWCWPPTWSPWCCKAAPTCSGYRQRVSSNAIYGNSGNNILDGGAGADMLTGGCRQRHLRVPRRGKATATPSSTSPATARRPGICSFVGYGAGATFTNIDATHWQVNYNGGASHDIITFIERRDRSTRATCCSHDAEADEPTATASLPKRGSRRTCARSVEAAASKSRRRPTAPIWPICPGPAGRNPPLRPPSVRRRDSGGTR